MLDEPCGRMRCSGVDALEAEPAVRALPILVALFTFAVAGEVRAQLCGDGTWEAPEVCDWSDDDDSGCEEPWFCQSNCSTCSACGDGTIEPPDEGCEPGFCGPGQTCIDCLYCAWCGNGIWEASIEACDGSAAAGPCPPGLVCNGFCTGCTSCGNGLHEPPAEFCDPSDLVEDGCAAGEICLASCNACTTCGNGLVDPAESCDPTALPSGCNPLDLCADDCSACVPACGDGIQQPGPPFLEECDFAHPQGDWICQLVGHDSCTNDCECRDGTCGDAVIDAPWDACDPPGAVGPDGGCDAGDTCHTGCVCRSGACGDGVVDPFEGCDPNHSPQGCSAPDTTCLDASFPASQACTCAEPRCGDGIVDAAAGEECEETADCLAGQVCRAAIDPLACQCVVPSCGDGFVDYDEGGEECDPPDEGICDGLADCIARGLPGECTCVAEVADLPSIQDRRGMAALVIALVTAAVVRLGRRRA